MNAVTRIEPATGLALLRAPFPPNQISKLPKPIKKDAQKGRCPECGGWHGLPAVHLDYVGHAALTDRLLDADPAWTWEPVSFGSDGLPALDRNGGMWIKLTVCGVTRLGYGSADGKSGGDAVKEIIGDALRNAAMRFGAALDLWHKGDLHADEGEDQPAPQETQRNPQPAPERAISEEQRHTLMTLATQAGVTAPELLRKCKITSLADLPAGKFDAVRQWLVSKLKADAAPANQQTSDILEDEVPY